MAGHRRNGERERGREGERERERLINRERQASWYVVNRLMKQSNNFSEICEVLMQPFGSESVKEKNTSK